MDGSDGGTWCETSTDFDLLVELIAHALADEDPSTIQVAHHQSVARQKCKLVADFGVRMHLAWAQHLLDNREFIQMKGRFPSSGPRSGKGDVSYDSGEEERAVESDVDAHGEVLHAVAAAVPASRITGILHC